MVTNNKPQIRFKGFSDEWEQRKLSEILKLFGGNAFSSKSSTDNGIPWLKIANVDMNGIDWSTESFLPAEYWGKYPNYRLFPDDYVMALTRPILNHKLKIGKVDKESLLNQRVAKLQFELNKEFTFQLIQIRSVIAKIENELAGTDPPNLGVKNLNNISVMISKNLEEQKKIGEFFKSLDETIALHQQKLDSTKQLKKAMLQKMFPKKGSNIPEIRFKGFSEEWEEAKLGDYCSLKGGNSWSSKDYNNKGEYKLITISNVKGNPYIDPFLGEYIDITEGNEKYILNEEDILITMTGNVGRVSKVPRGKFVLNQRVCKAIPEGLDANYLFVLLSSTCFENFCLLKGQGLAQLNISNKTISLYNFKKPSKKEQELIGNYFKDLDTQISSLENKLDTYKQFKKAMLQKMFV